MRIIIILLIVSLHSCSHQKERPFIKERICSREALDYLNSPRNKYKVGPISPNLSVVMNGTQEAMQACYEAFIGRSKHEEFQTCLVVGVNQVGKVEFYNFSSQEAKLDETFIQCAHKVTKKISYPDFGKNYILIQSYNFFYK